MTKEEWTRACYEEAARLGLDLQFYQTENGLCVGYIQFYRTWTDMDHPRDWCGDHAVKEEPKKFEWN